MKIRTKIAAAFILLATAYPAVAYDVATEARVTSIEVTYMPGRVVIMVDRQVGICQAGAQLTYIAHGTTQSDRDQNAQAALATLLTARAANLPIFFYFTNQECRINYLYLK